MKQIKLYTLIKEELDNNVRMFANEYSQLLIKKLNNYKPIFAINKWIIELQNTHHFSKKYLKILQKDAETLRGQYNLNRYKQLIRTKLIDYYGK